MNICDRERIMDGIEKVRALRFSGSAIHALGYEVFYHGLDGFSEIRTVRCSDDGYTFTAESGKKYPYTEARFEADKEDIIEALSSMLANA